MTGTINLFDLTSELMDLMEGLQSDDEAVIESSKELFEVTAENYTEKMGGYIRVLKTLQHDADAMNSEAKIIEEKAKKLKAAAKAKENACARLKERMIESLSAIGIESVQTTLGKISKSKAPPAMVIAHERAIPENFYTAVPATKKLDKTALKAHIIKEGETFDGVTVESKTIIRIHPA